MHLIIYKSLMASFKNLPNLNSLRPLFENNDFNLFNEGELL